MEEIELNKTQRRVFDYMLENGSISTLDAFLDLGETRLSARIFELKKKGVKITKQNIKVMNRHGESRRVCLYKIG